jgi:hypothetical protein
MTNDPLVEMLRAENAERPDARFRLAVIERMARRRARREQALAVLTLATLAVSAAALSEPLSQWLANPLALESVFAIVAVGVGLFSARVMLGFR